jgi:hypothetical protein
MPGGALGRSGDQGSGEIDRAAEYLFGGRAVGQDRGGSGARLRLGHAPPLAFASQALSSHAIGLICV